MVVCNLQAGTVMMIKSDGKPKQTNPCPHALYGSKDEFAVST